MLVLAATPLEIAQEWETRGDDGKAIAELTAAVTNSIALMKAAAKAAALSRAEINEFIMIISPFWSRPSGIPNSMQGSCQLRKVV